MANKSDIARNTHATKDASQFITSPSSSDRSMTAVKDIVFGSFAGIIGKIIEYPFDTVKVRLQSQVELIYSGPIDCFRKSFAADGFSGLYRGVSAPLVGAAAENSSLFFSYRVAQDSLKSITGYTDLSFASLIGCGAVSGAFTSVILTPIELVKCKMQVPFIQTDMVKVAPTVLSIIKDIHLHQGIGGFWHGQMGTLIRETGGSAAWFGSNEGVKILFRRYNGIDAVETESSDTELAIWQKLVAGASAGVSYNFLFYPADTIKSRMQTEDIRASKGNVKRDFWSIGRALWKTQGVKGLYRGCGITVARAAPSSAVVFTIHDALMRAFN